jgi:hypothetical protein
MKKTFDVYLLTVLLCCLPMIQANAQRSGDSAFQSFLSEHFRQWNQKELTMRIFGDSVINDLIDRDVASKYLPSSDSWQGGCFVKRKDFIIAFMHHYCMDSGNRLFIEDTIDSLTIVVFSKEGELIDSRVIGKIGHLEYVRTTGNIDKLQFTSEQASFTDMDKYSKYEDLDFTVTRHAYSIDKHGHIIEKTIGKPWTETKRQKHTLPSNRTFNDFLKQFPLWNKPYVNDSIFITKTELGDEYGRFVPDYLTRECGTQEITWRSCSHIEQDSVDVFFINKDCDMPCKDCYPYNENIVMTFNKNGQMIDYCPLARYGDLWTAEMKVVSSPLVFTVKQKIIDSTEINIDSPKNVTYATYIYQIKRNGKIIKTLSDQQDEYIRQNRKSKNDTLFIENKRCALFVNLSHAQIDMLRSKFDSKESFYVSSDDAMWYVSQASEFLKKHQIQTIYIDTMYNVICFNHSYYINTPRTGMSDIILYDQKKRPKIISAIDIEEEYKKYF